MKISLLLSIILLYNTLLAQNKITIIQKPTSPFIEKGECKQIINFDFLLQNNTTDTLTLEKITVSVFSEDRHLLHSRFLDSNGTAPGIEIVSNRTLNGLSSQLLFNPFTEFDLTLPLEKLTYDFTFSDNQNNEFESSITISPRQYKQKLALKLPMKGKVLIYDGHDFYAHHRRFDYALAPIQALGINSNFMRYAYDFVLLDKNNKQFGGTGSNDSDYFGFGKPVYAVDTGIVIYASNHYKDDKSFNAPNMATNPLELYGNCIAIMHPDSSVSVYGHLQQNSLKVKRDDIVKPLQQIASIGVSGSSFFPHLHFEVRTSIKSTAEGVPSYFSNVLLVMGNRKTKIESGLLETGNIIETE